MTYQVADTPTIWYPTLTSAVRSPDAHVEDDPDVTLPSYMAYEEVLDDLDVTQYRIFTGAVNPAVSLSGQALSAACIAAGYDWSGYTPRIYSTFIRDGETEEVGYTRGFPCTLITEHYAVAANHICPTVDSVCYWKAPDGTEKSATVTSISRIGTTDIELIYFEEAPAAVLKRYAIGIDTELLTGLEVYNPEVTGNLWMFTLGATTITNHTMLLGTSWAAVPLEYGSGMPLFVGINGDLVLLGTNHYSIAFQNYTQDYAVIEAAVAPDTITFSSI